MDTELPAYDPLQSAYHRAFRRELYRMLDRLPFPAGGRALDAPCGDGFYATRLAERGEVVALDIDPAYLREAQRESKSATMTVASGDVYALDFPAESFDLIFCGQSLITLDDAPRAIAEFTRVLRPNGVLAVYESDEYHHVLLPWPVGLEVAVHSALHAASRDKYGSGAKLAATRSVFGHLRDAGYRTARRKTFAMDRVAPFRKADRRFLRLHLQFLRKMVAERLTSDQLEKFDAFATSEDEESFLGSGTAEFTCLGALYSGRKGG